MYYHKYLSLPQKIKSLVIVLPVGYHNLSSPVSDQNTKNTVYNDVYNNDGSHYFGTPLEQNHSATKLFDKTTKTTKSRLKDHTHTLQKIL